MIMPEACLNSSPITIADNTRTVAFPAKYVEHHEYKTQNLEMVSQFSTNACNLFNNATHNLSSGIKYQQSEVNNSRLSDLSPSLTSTKCALEHFDWSLSFVLSGTEDEDSAN